MPISKKSTKIQLYSYAVYIKRKILRRWLRPDCRLLRRRTVLNGLLWRRLVNLRLLVCYRRRDWWRRLCCRRGLLRSDFDWFIYESNLCNKSFDHCHLLAVFLVAVALDGSGDRDQVAFFQVVIEIFSDMPEYRARDKIRLCFRFSFLFLSFDGKRKLNK